jgi:hypothetical protein
VAYFSPCIEYSGHPRYAKPWKLKDGKNAGKWLQMVLMCRVNPDAISQRKQETMLKEPSVRIHEAIGNEDMEWLLIADRCQEGKDYVSWGRNVICYGLMTRMSDDPRQLPQAKWGPFVHGHLLWSLPAPGA